MDECGLHKLAALRIGKSNQGHAGQDGMSSARELFEGAAGIFAGAGLSENVAVKNDNGIGGDHDGGADGARGDQIGFGVGQALHKFVRILAGIRGLIDSRGKHGERKSCIPQNFGAARGGGGENQLQGYGLKRRILQTESLHSCALGQ